MKEIRFYNYMKPVENYVSDRSIEEEDYTCENCDAAFASNVGLKIHELQSKAFCYTCKLCMPGNCDILVYCAENAHNLWCQAREEDLYWWITFSGMGTEGGLIIVIVS